MKKIITTVGRLKVLGMLAVFLFGMIFIQESSAVVVKWYKAKDCIYTPTLDSLDKANDRAKEAKEKHMKEIVFISSREGSDKYTVVACNSAI